MKLTIGTKLGFAFGTIILLLAVSAGAAFYNISRMRSDLNHVLDQAVPTMHSCNRLLAYINQASSGLRGFLVMDQNEARANEFKAENSEGWQGAMDELALLAKYAAADDGTVQRQEVDRITQLARELRGCHQQIFALRTKAGAQTKDKVIAEAERIWSDESTPRSQEIGRAVEKIVSAADAQESRQREHLEAASRMTVMVLLVATLVSIVVGCVVAVLLSRRIVKVVRSLAERAKLISEGDLRGSAVVMRGADELGHLADGFNVMLVNLRDLTTQILSVTENVNSATSQISSSTKQQASSTREQAATVQEITSTMQEISQSGGQIVAKAKEIAAVAEQASSASKAGMDAVQSTNRTMAAIREQVEEVAENIVALSEKTQAIGEIISTVNEIAEQSNLLALNATIEAADAGEEGNRFAVVAGEMKNLADQAKECTVHVRKILGEIQKAINTSVMLTEEAVKRVESGKQQADVSENVIRQIASTTEESIQAFQQIIGATNQQQVGLEQVARGMKDIDQAAQQTATGTGQLEQAVVSLSAMSKQLRTAVASYKV
ncbi:MAG TPA: methyl-accepting chemotaxis protein [Lacipirellulaceae bacterium]|nr:methyl-accepting chemotaxis protein [Lacipirellulaceae bacterium]